MGIIYYSPAIFFYYFLCTPLFFNQIPKTKNCLSYHCVNYR